MKARTQILIGAAVVALGVTVVAIGAMSGESTVRQVADVLDAPEAHAHGTFTVLGVPESQLIARAGNATLVPNPEWRNATQRVVPWTREGVLYHSTLTLTATSPDASGASRWTLVNETRRAGHREDAFPTTNGSWTLAGPHQVFLIEGFADAQGHPTLIWGVHRGNLAEALAPKPSQFKGHLMTATFEGASLPSGALVWSVDEYTAGCSSKFIPPDARAKYAQEAGGAGP